MKNEEQKNDLVIEVNETTMNDQETLQPPPCRRRRGAA